MRKIIFALAAVSLLAGSAPSFAGSQCRDKSGKFVKCPTKAPAKAKQCRDSKGKFIKCK